MTNAVLTISFNGGRGLHICSWCLAIFLFIAAFKISSVNIELNELRPVSHFTWCLRGVTSGSASTE